MVMTSGSLDEPDVASLLRMLKPAYAAAAANSTQEHTHIYLTAAAATAAPLLLVQVYDATPFLDEHPGGAESILISAGMDATDEFNSIHSSKAKGMLAQYYIGGAE